MYFYSYHRLFIDRNDNYLLRKKFGDDTIPDVALLAKKVSLVLVNQHFSFSGPRPLSTQVIEIGGVHIEEEKPLPQVYLIFIFFQ